MNRRLSCVLALLLAACGPDPAAEDAVIHFSELRSGQSIHIERRSRGCFHNDVLRARITPVGSGRARVSGAAREAYAFWSRPERFRSTLGTAELRGLDSLFSYYRGEPTGMCTTTDEITVTLYRGRRRVRQERFVDSTCPGMFANPETSLIGRLAPNAR